MKPDVIIIGSGMGGATYAAALAPSGQNILILERGERLQSSTKDRDAKAIFVDRHFVSDETWHEPSGAAFRPGNYALVGGNSKLYGAALIRFREQDFRSRAHAGGKTPDWPLRYEDLEIFYGQAEDLYQVRGLGEPLDPTEPPHSRPYPFSEIPHEPDISWLSTRLRAAGLSPTHIPLGIDLEAWLGAGKTPWDAYPNTGVGKMDAETCGLKTALQYPNVELRTGVTVERLIPGDGGRIASIQVQTQAGEETLSADIIILAAGAVQSAALLLKSTSESYPTGLANRSDQVGRNFMNHNASAVMAMKPWRRNQAVYQKTLMLNDFYDQGPGGQGPLGNVQMLGKISAPILKANMPWLPSSLARWISNRSFDFYAMSEDLPDPRSRVTLDEDQIMLNWHRTNWVAHEELVKALKQTLRKAGFPVVVSKAFDHRTPSHQCGTIRMGDDPQTSAINSYGQSHDHPNLIIADASSFVTSAAVNPALTIAALALRSAQALMKGKIG